MGKSFRLFGMALMGIFLCASCSSENDKNEPSVPKDPIEDFEQGDMNFTEKAGEQSFTFTANVDWNLSVASTSNGASWCTVSPNKGSAGTQTIKVNVSENDTYDNRSVTITLKAGTESKYFVVTQKQKDAILLTSDKFEVNQKGGTIHVEVKANVEYTAEIGETCKDWIKESPNTRGLNTTTKTYTIATNEDTEKREGSIVFSDGTQTETVHVYQTGGDIILLTQNEYYADAAGENITVELKSNCEYEVEMPDVDWVHETQTRGMSSHTLYYTIDANESYDSREAKIVYRNKAKETADTLTITQAQKDAIILGQKEITVKSEGETIEVKLSANVNYEVEMPDVDWITTASTRGLTEHTLYYKIAKNEDDDSRSAKITFKNKGKGIEDILTITQQGEKPVAKTTINVTEAGTLANYIGEERRKTIKEIKITGNINIDDIKVIGEMTSLQILDLSEANIIGGGTYRIIYNPDNTRPGYTDILVEDDIIKAKMLPASIKYFYAPKTLKEICGFYQGSTISSAFSSYVSDENQNTYRESSGLKKIELPTSLTTIGVGAFGETLLTKIDIPDNVSTIDDYAFFDNGKLQEVTFGSNLKTIGKSCFAYCTSLSKIELPEGIEEIEDEAFYRCRGEYIYIPSTLKRIGEYAFTHTYDSLSQIVVSCSNLEDWLAIDFANESANPLHAKISYSGDRSESHLYVNHNIIKSLTIPQSNTAIKNYAFVGCTAIEDVTIGNQVTTIGNRAFKDCSNLIKVIIGDGISTISASVFSKCEKLETIYIGKNVTKIESEAFYNVPGNEVHCLSTTPPSIGTSNQFNKRNKETAKLYVPKGAYQAYFLSDWGVIFTNIIEMEE